MAGKMLMMSRILVLTLFVVSLFTFNVFADEIVVEIGDEVLVSDTMPFGINMGMRDPYWDVNLRQSVVTCNFEGGLHRDIYRMYAFEGGGNRPSVDPHSAKRGLGPRDIHKYIGGTYTVVSGPLKWKQGVVAGVELMKDGKYDRAVLDLEPALEDTTGAIMLHRVVPDEPYDGKEYGVRVENNCTYVFNESAPDSFGNMAVRMDGSKDTALVRLFPGAQQRMDLNITWGMRLRVKAAEGEPQLRIHTEQYGEEQTIKPGGDWQLLDLQFKVDKMPEWPEELTYLRFHLETTGGVLLIDDLEVWRMDNENRNEFRDVAVDTFQQADIGIVRILQGANSTLEDTIRPVLQSRNGIGSLHNFYGFCEMIGAEPWYCLPATLTREEMTMFMEYLAGPASTEGGKLRAELGHPEPWLHTLPGVIIEFGNELYNFGGFGGPDYWHDLIETGKASEWYKPEQTRFIMGHQGQALQYAQNMDGFATGGYMCWGFSKEGYEKYLKEPAQLQKWAAAASVVSVTDPERSIPHDATRCKELGIVPAMYEGSFHINFGNGPSEPRNRLVTSMGAASSYMTHMLLKLKHFGMRRQCFFATLGTGISFSNSGAFGAKEAGYVRIWGNIIRLQEDEKRLRPGWLALSAINQVMGGELLQTTHSTEPTFTITAPMPWTFRDIRKLSTLEATEFKDVPVLHSFAFRDGNKRSVILVNLDVDKSHTVLLRRLGNNPRSAKIWSLVGESPFANNELDWNPDETQVRVENTEWPEFSEDAKITLLPMQIHAIQWHVD